MIDVVIASRNGREHLAACLPTLLPALPAGGRVTVVDNGSTDGTVAWLAAQYPEVAVLAFPDNLGYPEANNLGIRRAQARGARYVLLLNNDTRLAPECLAELLAAAAENPDAALLEATQVTWDGAMRLASVLVPEHARGELREAPIEAKPGEPFETGFANGCCLLINAAVLPDLGLLDASYFFYVEDIDLSLRAWALGYRVLSVPRAIVFHRVHATPIRSPGFLTRRNELTTLLKHYEWATLRRFARPILARWVFTRYPVALRATLAALWRLPRTLRDRHSLQARRRRSDAEIFARLGLGG